MLIFYSICFYVCYTLYKKLSLESYYDSNHIILENISMIDLYDNNHNYDNNNNKNHNYDSNDALFAFNQIPT
jgi:hypothetical protein